MTTNGHPYLLLNKYGHFPRFMDVLIWNFGKLRNPHSDVLASRVKFSRLSKRIEEQDFTWTNPATEGPASIVTLDVMVNQHFFEVVSPEAPILLQI